MSENTFTLDGEAIPETLVERVQRICWRAEDRDGKTTKIPVDPATGSFASTTDDRTWTEFERALEEQLERGDQNSDLETDAEDASAGKRESIWNRARRFVGEGKE